MQKPSTGLAIGIGIQLGSAHALGRPAVHLTTDSDRLLTIKKLGNFRLCGEYENVEAPVAPERSSFELQVLLPVHNEADSIEATIREIYSDLSPMVRMQFIVCEDGSRDDTKTVLQRVAQDLSVKLLLSDSRKGYSRAVKDGMLEADAPYLLCLDSDGQCDPKDFRDFWESRDKADILIGWRVDRADNWMRKLLSRTFYRIWRLLFGCCIHDPSCPYMLARRDVITRLAPRMGAMEQGFWWEFMARAHRGGFTTLEFPVHHRQRAAGVTQVYRLGKLPGIGYRHVTALFRIFRETRLPA